LPGSDIVVAEPHHLGEHKTAPNPPRSHCPRCLSLDRTSCVCPDLREWYERPRPDDNVPGAPESGWYSFTSS
ncbi:hypothetical protein KCU94_g187, partial [Aureobasidium melanogenum]